MKAVTYRSVLLSRIAALVFMLGTSLFLPGSISMAAIRHGKPTAAEVHGRIKFVTSFSDVKVKIVQSFGDLQVQVVQGAALSVGQWEIVDSMEDFRVELVDAFEDFTVEYVTAFPGLKK